MEKLKIILTTGGTGGHIFPALAVADALFTYKQDGERKFSDTEILFVGALYGKEKALAQKANLPFYGLNVRGIKGRGIRKIGAIFSMIKAIKESYTLLKEKEPDAVIGFGGYACFATVFAAKLHGIPCLIHEQNAIPGLANKVLSYFVDRICLSLPDTNKVFNPKKCVLTGNPVRSEITNINPEVKRAFKNSQENNEQKNLLIMGGSLGATTINSLAIQLLNKFRDHNISLIHQCGEVDFPRVQEAYKSHGFTQEEIDKSLFAFIDDMAICYKKADLALCRAGATSIAELTATGTPAIFIPFPFAANDHQTANAKILEKENAALVFSEEELKTKDISSIILGLLTKSSNSLEKMSTNSYKLANINAAKSVSEEILKLIN